MVWFGALQKSLACWHSGLAWCGPKRLVLHASASNSMVWYVMTWFGLVWFGTKGLGLCASLRLEDTAARGAS